LIYAVKVKGQSFVKIGWTQDGSLRSRMQNIQLANPHEIELLANAPGKRPEELAIHIRLKRVGLHHRGEWFRLEGETLVVLAEMREHEQETYVTRQQWHSAIARERREAGHAVTRSSRARDPVAARRQERMKWWADRGIAVTPDIP
jgi:hypothetical protein